MLGAAACQITEVTKRNASDLETTPAILVAEKVFVGNKVELQSEKLHGNYGRYSILYIYINI